jgi:hypothetical protein
MRTPERPKNCLGALSIPQKSAKLFSFAAPGGDRYLYTREMALRLFANPPPENR